MENPNFTGTSLDERRDFASVPTTNTTPAQAPVEADASDDPQSPEANSDRRHDPLTDSTGTGTFVGKKVFSPNELNQAGEDKEYFNPKDQHHFTVPKDANEHDLTPDLQLKEKSHDPKPALKKD